MGVAVAVVVVTRVVGGGWTSRVGASHIKGILSPSAAQGPSPPTPSTQVAAAVTGANRTFAVWDESYGDWPFAGTPALPNGSVLFVWQHQDSIANMTRDGYNVVAVPSASW